MYYYVIKIKVEQQEESAELFKIKRGLHAKLIVQLLEIPAMSLSATIHCVTSKVAFWSNPLNLVPWKIKDHNPQLVVELFNYSFICTSIVGCSDPHLTFGHSYKMTYTLDKGIRWVWTQQVTYQESKQQRTDLVKKQSHTKMSLYGCYITLIWQPQKLQTPHW